MWTHKKNLDLLLALPAQHVAEVADIKDDKKDTDLLLAQPAFKVIRVAANGTAVARSAQTLLPRLASSPAWERV